MGYLTYSDLFRYRDIYPTLVSTEAMWRSVPYNMNYGRISYLPIIFCEWLEGIETMTKHQGRRYRYCVPVTLQKIISSNNAVELSEFQFHFGNCTSFPVPVSLGLRRTCLNLERDKGRKSEKERVRVQFKLGAHPANELAVLRTGLLLNICTNAVTSRRRVLYQILTEAPWKHHLPLIIPHP